MIPLTLAEIAAATDGIVADGDADVVVRGDAFLDSRSPVAGGLFVAVPGERVDGHEYARQAVNGGGATAALVQRPVGVPSVVVSDTVVGLGRLAAHVRRQLTGLQVIAITGSQGKTSTKDLLATILESAGPTVSPPASFNNEIGVPLTALRADRRTRYLVSEMGARGLGHIGYLCSLVSPTIGIELNVGVAHLGEFGSRESIAEAKAELVEALPPDGIAVLNVDDPLVAAMASRTTATVVGFGVEARATVRIGKVALDHRSRPTFDLMIGSETAHVTLPLIGEHQAYNAAAAAAAAYAAQIPFAAIVAGLVSARARSRWRMEVTTSPAGYTLINDAYNANPDSLAAALRALASWDRTAEGRTIAVLGEMRELGEASDARHHEAGDVAAGLGIDIIVVVGDRARAIVDGARGHAGWVGEAIWVPDVAEAIPFLRGALRSSDVVLVKASRAAALERVAQALEVPEEAAR
jgi:UDP-N-acetylmuramoyl-tripeptide--D-alanyl-D-alanine ligase